MNCNHFLSRNVKLFLFLLCSSVFQDFSRFLIEKIQALSAAWSKFNFSSQRFRAVLIFVCISKFRWYCYIPLVKFMFVCLPCMFLLQVLDDDGIAAPGEIIRSGDIYLNKQVPIVTRGPIRSGLKDRLAICFMILHIPIRPLLV